MKFHFLYKEKEENIYSKGVNIYAPNLIDAIMEFEKKFPEVILLAIFTNNFKK